MAIKRTAKYVAALAAARELGLAVAMSHDSAEELYTELESLLYWDSRRGEWVERKATDPLREMDRALVRIRVTAHLDSLDEVCQRVLVLLEQRFDVLEVSRTYPNVRDSDGAGRVYIAVRKAGA